MTDDAEIGAAIDRHRARARPPATDPLTRPLDRLVDMVLDAFPALQESRAVQQSMSAPRLEVDLGAVEDNTRTLVERLGAARHPGHRRHQGRARLARRRPRPCSRRGASGLGDSRIENLAGWRPRGLGGPLTLIRSPMLSQVDGVVRHARRSLNTERPVLEALSPGRRPPSAPTHAVVLMVELGDLREGILPADLVPLAVTVAGLAGTDPRPGSAPTWPARAASCPTRTTWASCPTSPTTSRRRSGRRWRWSPAATPPTSTGRWARTTSAGSTTCASASRSCSASSR